MHLLDPEPGLPNSQLNTMGVKELALYTAVLIQPYSQYRKSVHMY